MKGSLLAILVLAVLGAGVAGWMIGRKQTVPETPAPAPAPQVTVALPVESAPPAAVPEPIPPKKEVPEKTAISKPKKAPEPKPAEKEDVIVLLPPTPIPPEPTPAPAPVVVAAAEPAPAAQPEAKPVEEKPAPKPREPSKVTLPAGTLITVRLREGLSSERNSEGDAFHATLDRPLVIEGLVIAERGSLQRGKIATLARAGKVKGQSSLGIELMELSTADGQRVPIQTETFVREGGSDRSKDAAKAGVAAGIGAAIGAMAGGGKGAGIGAAIGGAAGAGAVLATRGPAAELESETRITFRLKEPVTLTEQIK